MLSKLLCLIFLIFTLSSNVIHYHYYFQNTKNGEATSERMLQRGRQMDPAAKEAFMKRIYCYNECSSQVHLNTEYCHRKCDQEEG